MSAEAFRRDTDLAHRAVMTLRDNASGKRFVSFAELHAVSPDGVREFATALLAEGERLGFVVEYRVVEGPASGLEFRWRPAS